MNGEIPTGDEDYLKFNEKLIYLNNEQMLKVYIKNKYVELYKLALKQTHDNFNDELLEGAGFNLIKVQYAGVTASVQFAYPSFVLHLKDFIKFKKYIM